MINEIKKKHDDSLELICLKNKVESHSIKKLLEAEKTKNVLKRSSLMQQTIDKEIENTLGNEN